jgi:hypothetical protein
VLAGEPLPRLPTRRTRLAHSGSTRRDRPTSLQGRDRRCISAPPVDVTMLHPLQGNRHAPSFLTLFLGKSADK